MVVQEELNQGRVIGAATKHWKHMSRWKQQIESFADWRIELIRLPALIELPQAAPSTLNNEDSADQPAASG